MPLPRRLLDPVSRTFLDAGTLSEGETPRGVRGAPARTGNWGWVSFGGGCHL